METRNGPAPCVQSFSEGVSYTTTDTAATTKLKMDHEKYRYENALSQLNVKCREAEELCSRNVQQAKDDHLKLVAYSRVYQIHSFDKYDPFKDDPIDSNTRRKCKRKPKRRKPREKSFVTLPNLEKDNPETLVNSPDVKQPSNLTYAALNAHCFPQIVTHENEEIETDNKSRKSFFSAIVMWKNTAKKIREKKQQEQDRNPKNQEPVQRSILKQDRQPRKNLLPGDCKTQAELKRFMEKEALQLMQEMTIPKHKKVDSIRKMVEKAQLPELIKRDKTFSAIVRDYKTYKEEKEARKHRKMIEYVTRHFNCKE